MGVPYEIKPMVNVEVLGVPVVVEVDWPNRSVISKIIVTTTEGVGEAFGVTLYNHPQVLDGVQVSDSVGGEGNVGKIPDECFQVTPTLIANNLGRLLYFSDQATGGYGYVFFSQKDLTGRQGQATRKLYVKIWPVGAGVKKVAICIGGMKEVE